MDISGVGSSALLSSTLSINSTTAVTSTASSQDGSDLLSGATSSTAGAGPAATSDISNPGKLYSKLESLEKSDPAKFQQIMADAAQKFKDAAAKATDPTQQKMLTDMASKFENVANGSAALSSLKPPTGQGKGPAAAYQASDNNQQQSVLDALNSSSGTSSASGAQKAHHGHHAHGAKTNPVADVFKSIETELDAAASTTSTSSTAATTTAAAS